VGNPKSDPPPEVLSKYTALYASYQAAYPECRFFDGCYAYDAVIRALGWHFDTGVFGDAVRPALVGEESSISSKEAANGKKTKTKTKMKTKPTKEEKEEKNPGGAARIVGKYPAMTPHYESVNVPGLFFAGALAHSLDYKKAAGGFIHGFRYTAQAMVRDLLRRFHGQPWEVQDLKGSVAAVVEAVIARLRSSSSLWQMYGVIGDVVLLTSHATAAAASAPAASAASSGSGSDDADSSDSTSSESGLGSSTHVPPTSVNFKYVKDVPIAMLNTPEFVASLLHRDGVDRGGGGGGGEAKGDSASSSSSSSSTSSSSSPQLISYVTVVFEWGAASYGPHILNEPGGQNKFLHPVMRLHGPLAQDLCKSPLRKLRGNLLNGEAEKEESLAHFVPPFLQVLYSSRVNTRIPSSRATR
jgi:hypothetical protein